MCVGCGGTCSTTPRFTTPAAGPNLRIIGTAMGPTMQPAHLVQQLPDAVGYRTLYTGLTPGGEPAPAVLPGTFGGIFGAGRKGAPV